MTSSRFGQFAVPVGVVGIVLLLVVPVPSVVLDVIITLHARGDHVELRVVKYHDFAPAGVLPLKLDPKTLLIAQDR